MSLLLLYLAIRFLYIISLGVDKEKVFGYKVIDVTEDLYVNGVYTPGEEFLI